MLSCYPAIQLVTQSHTRFLFLGHKPTSPGLPFGSAAHHLSLRAFSRDPLCPTSAAGHHHQRSHCRRQRLHAGVLDRGGQQPGSSCKHRRRRGDTILAAILAPELGGSIPTPSHRYPHRGHFGGCHHGDNASLPGASKPSPIASAPVRRLGALSPPSTASITPCRQAADKIVKRRQTIAGATSLGHKVLSRVATNLNRHGR